jgi:hypothetical protein
MMKNETKGTQTMASTYEDMKKHLHISSLKWYMIYETIALHFLDALKPSIGKENN